MTLNLPLLYFVWTEEYCQPSPNKNKLPNLWHVTSILVCCIFDYKLTIRKFLTVVDAVVVSSWSFFKRLDGAGGGHFPRILAKFETWLTCSEAFVAFVTSLLAVDFCNPLWLLAAFFLAKKAAAVVCWSLDPIQKKRVIKIYSFRFLHWNHLFQLPF